MCIRDSLKTDGVGIGQVGVTADALGRLVGLVDSGVISSSAGKTVFEKMYGTGLEAQVIVERENLVQIGDRNELEALVTRVISEQPDAVARVRGGHEGTLGFLVGQVMKASRGRANPKLAGELLRQQLRDPGTR